MEKIIFGFFILINFCDSALAINPDKEYDLTPDSIGWSYTQLLIQTEDNFDLNTWIYNPNPEEDKKTVLILAYPDAGNMSYFVYHAATLANAGFTVVTFDYRGFGKSTDFDINPNYLYYTEFSDDLEAVVNKIDVDFNNHKIGIWAMSMGTTITAGAFPKIHNKMDFIVGEGFVTDTALLKIRIKEQTDKDIILPETSDIFSEAIGQIDIPLLILSGSTDERTTTKDAEELKTKLKGHCKIVEYDGGHLTGFQAWKDKAFGQGYVEQINLFLEKK